MSSQPCVYHTALRKVWVSLDFQFVVFRRFSEVIADDRTGTAMKGDITREKSNRKITEDTDLECEIRLKNRKYERKTPIEVDIVQRERAAPSSIGSANVGEMRKANRTRHLTLHVYETPSRH